MALALGPMALAAAALLALSRDSFRPAAPSVCILMFSTPNLLPQYAQLASDINEAYARRHGYAFKHFVAESPDVKPTWQKVAKLRELLDQYRVVMWMDSDAAFNDHATSLDRWIQNPSDLIGCSDHPNGPYAINCGVVIVKSTPWAKAFLETWWDMRTLPRYAEEWAFEQSAMHDLIRENAMGCTDRIHIEPATAFNSIWAEIQDGRRDTFVLHFMAMSADERKHELLALRDRLAP